MTTTTPRDGYQMILTVGADAPAIDGATVVDMTPAASTAAAVIERIVASELSPGDLRAKALVVVGDDAHLAVLAYAALVGFAGRRLDVAQGTKLLGAERIDVSARNLADAGKPAPVPSQVQVGAEHPVLPSLHFDARISPEDASAVRYARRVRLVPSGSSLETITQFLVVAGIRARGDVDRFPYLCDGTEAFDPADPVAEVGLCLDTLRRDALAARRAQRSGDRDSLAPVVEPSQRAQRLDAAAHLDIAEVMTRLGGLHNVDVDLWHCPRPERHTNGDRNPSMKVADGRTRCFRCDPERVDSLRLAMDCLDATADEAADWLLDPTQPTRDVVRPVPDAA